MGDVLSLTFHTMCPSKGAGIHGMLRISRPIRVDSASGVALPCRPTSKTNFLAKWVEIVLDYGVLYL
jgi:hypothetical protein